LDVVDGVVNKDRFVRSFARKDEDEEQVDPFTINRFVSTFSFSVLRFCLSWEVKLLGFGLVENGDVCCLMSDDVLFVHTQSKNQSKSIKTTTTTGRPITTTKTLRVCYTQTPK
jgi:hypothetical protein